MFVRCFEGLEGLIQLKPEWEELFLCCINPVFYNDWRWHYAINKFLIKENVYYFGVYETKKPNMPIAILPLRIDRQKKYGFPIACLGFPYHPEFATSDMLVHKDKAHLGLLDCILAHINQTRVLHWDVLELERFTDRSGTFALIDRERASVDGECAFVVRNGHGNLLKSLSKKQVKNVDRQIKNAEKHYGKVEFLRVHKTAEIETAYKTFLEIEKTGWKGEDGTQTAIVLRPAITAFYRYLLCSFAESGESIVNLVAINGMPAAGQIGLRSGACLSLLKIGYNECLKEIGPGGILLLQCLERETKDSTYEVNLVTNPPWSARWHFDVENKWDFILFNRTPYAKCLQMGLGLKGLLNKGKSFKPIVNLN